MRKIYNAYKHLGNAIKDAIEIVFTGKYFKKIWNDSFPISSEMLQLPSTQNGSLSEHFTDLLN